MFGYFLAAIPILSHVMRTRTPPVWFSCVPSSVFGILILSKYLCLYILVLPFPSSSFLGRKFSKHSLRALKSARNNNGSLNEELD